jgi:hypothetical protein
MCSYRIPIYASKVSPNPDWVGEEVLCCYLPSYSLNNQVINETGMIFMLCPLQSVGNMTQINR